jgi:hypothetical protein
MRKPKILLDCGAFGAFRRGETLDVRSYVSFIQRNKHLIDQYVSLDVIPGKAGNRESNRDAIEAASRASYKNHQIMKDAGLSPIPVFHQDERFYWVEKLIDDGEHYVGISPYLKSGPDTIRWLDKVFNTLNTRDGPIVRTHGFGLTSAQLCVRYPWASVDSSTWMKEAIMGQIPIPVYDDRLRYYLPRRTISVTERTSLKSNHIDHLSDVELDKLHRYLGEIGVPITLLRYDYTARWRMWIAYFLGLEQSCTTRSVPPALLHGAHKSRTLDWCFNLVFVTNMTRQQRDVLFDAQVNCLLLTYFELKDLRQDALEDYVAGRMRPPSRRKLKPDWGSDRYHSYRALALYRRSQMQLAGAED